MTSSAEPDAPLRVGTHSGSFHADEVFALAALRLVHGPLEIVRTRDRDVLDGCALRVDVGRRHDPASGDFDHHQGGVGERPNGIRYASFGLVWREHGAAICGGDAIAAAVDAHIVSAIDAPDNGQELFDLRIDDVAPYTVSGAIAALNPAWDEPEEDERPAFDAAVDLASTVLRREIARAQARERATVLVREALDRRDDPRILELEQGMPWRDAVLSDAPDVLYVLAPRSSGEWTLQCAPAAAHGFANRRSLPEAWSGLEGEDLQRATGVTDAVFCHVARFLAVAGSREGALALARLALVDEA
ncbi:MAG: MYG1 family protein [Solirubrobacteraceae bacterium]|nr:MYG1 family protein [Solirubrobacteraceae bacterium]